MVIRVKQDGYFVRVILSRVDNGVERYIAPLQPPTLAAFPPWGGSEGAGRAASTGRQR